MACKIRYFGYDIYELAPDMGSGDTVTTEVVKGEILDRTFADEKDALKAVCEHLGTEYHENDWCYETDLFCCETGGKLLGIDTCKCNDGWVLHIIVDGNNRYATERQIADWKKSGETELFDLLVNVFVEEVKV